MFKFSVAITEKKMILNRQLITVFSSVVTAIRCNGHDLLLKETPNNNVHIPLICSVHRQCIANCLFSDRTYTVSSSWAVISCNASLRNWQRSTLSSKKVGRKIPVYLISWFNFCEPRFPLTKHIRSPFSVSPRYYVVSSCATIPHSDDIFIPFKFGKPFFPNESGGHLGCCDCHFLSLTIPKQAFFAS